MGALWYTNKHVYGYSSPPLFHHSKLVLVKNGDESSFFSLPEKKGSLFLFPEAPNF